MKRFLLLLTAVLLLGNGVCKAQIIFSITDGVDDEGLKSRMERKVTRMLNEINAAQADDRNLNFQAMDMSDRMSESMAMLWKNTPFKCPVDTINEHCITTGSGYQIRNIPLLMKPTVTRDFSEEGYQEATINFDKKGVMESFHLSLSKDLYMNVVRSNLQLTDLRRRQMILNYVEQFRTAYNQKDIKFLEQIYSDDALIITGKVILQKRMVNDRLVTSQKIQYNKQTKQEYITKLRQTFKTARYFKVTFDDIEVVRHPVNPDYYGVTLHQGWSNNSYHDEGYLFLLWDFTDENAPQIHVRTWQPDKLNGKPLPEEEIFTLSDFDV